MSGVSILWIVWAALSAGTLALLLYRATLTLHEEDQLFLSDVAQKSHEHEDQDEIVRRVARIAPLLKGMTGATSLATLALVGIYVSHAVSVIASR